MDPETTSHSYTVLLKFMPASWNWNSVLPVGTVFPDTYLETKPKGALPERGGWIMSPLGAYPLNPSLSGKATFGFVSKYVSGKTVPTGNTEFQFHEAGMNFSSTVYEWLVVSGSMAQYKGSGTINGAGNYGFLLSAVDGSLTGGGGADKFRVKIWDKATGNV